MLDNLSWDTLYANRNNNDAKKNGRCKISVPKQKISISVHFKNTTNNVNAANTTLPLNVQSTTDANSSNNSNASVDTNRIQNATIPSKKSRIRNIVDPSNVNFSNLAIWLEKFASNFSHLNGPPYRR